MRKDKQARLDRFAKLIDDTIKAGDPHYMRVFEGAVWAALPQPSWCEKLQISDHTLRDLAKCSPIVATKTVNQEGKPTVLYRLGSVLHKSPRHLANIMACLYRAKYGVERVSRHNWGCLVGLANILPEGAQIEIFRAVLNDLPMFRSGVKCADPDSSHSMRYYEWLPIPLVRKYPDVALQVYIGAMQAAGKTPHPAVAALDPKSWPKFKSIGGK
jgi:hypothetical protein